MLLQSFDPFSNQVDFRLRCGNALLGLLLEDMNNPNILTKLKRVNDPISISPRFDRDLPHAASEPRQGLCAIRLAAFGSAAKASSARVTPAVSPARTR